MLSAVFFLFVAICVLWVALVLALSEHVSKKTVAELEMQVLRKQTRRWHCWVLEAVVNRPHKLSMAVWEHAGIQYWDYPADNDYVKFWPGPIWAPEPGETPRHSMAATVLTSYEMDSIEDDFHLKQERKDLRERRKPHRRCTLCGNRCDGRAQKRYGRSPWEQAAAARKAAPEMVYREEGHEQRTQELVDMYYDNPWDHFRGNPNDLDAIWAFKESLDNSSGRV